ncbi:MAG TPA: hypothetical protein VFZ43_00645 [Anaerolineales bacterium]
MNHDLSEIEERVKRYWYTDGVAELSSGAMFILLGVYFGVQGYLGQSSLVSLVLQVSLVLLMMAGAISVSWLVNILKARLTYPRTGFVEYHLDEQDARQRRYAVGTVAMIILIAWTVLFKLKYIRGFDSMVLVIGILAGVVFFTLRGRSSGVKRFHILGVSSFLLGIGLSLSGFPEVYKLAAFFGSLGVVILISGILVLRRYLNENPMPAENQNG